MPLRIWQICEILVMGESAVTMASTITTALANFTTDLGTVGAAAIGAAALLLWLGWRLACKIPNRGVGNFAL